MSRVVEPQENSVHSNMDPTDWSSRIETQSFRSGNASFDDLLEIRDRLARFARVEVDVPETVGQ